MLDSQRSDVEESNMPEYQKDFELEGKLTAVKRRNAFLLLKVWKFIYNTNYRVSWIRYISYKARNRTVMFDSDYLLQSRIKSKTDPIVLNKI